MSDNSHSTHDRDVNSATGEKEDEKEASAGAESETDADDKNIKKVEKPSKRLAKVFTVNYLLILAAGLVFLCAVIIVLKKVKRVVKIRGKTAEATCLLVRYAGFGSSPFTASPLGVSPNEQSHLDRAAACRRIYELAMCAYNFAHCASSEQAYIVGRFQSVKVLHSFHSAPDVFLKDVQNNYKNVPYKILADIYNSKAPLNPIPTNVSELVPPPTSYLQSLFSVLVGLLPVSPTKMSHDDFIETFQYSFKDSLRYLFHIISTILKTAHSSDALFLPIHVESLNLDKNTVAYYNKHRRLFQSLAHPFYHNQGRIRETLVSLSNDALLVYLKLNDANLDWPIFKVTDLP